jgi:hypothetical protein
MPVEELAEEVEAAVNKFIVAERTSYPVICYASGVHPSRAEELSDYLETHGCPTKVTPGGDPVYTSAEHRRKALKIRGMYNRNPFPYS